MDTTATLPTGFSYVTCVLTDPCRFCGGVFGEDDDPWHWASLAQAHKALAEVEWQATPDGLICDTCIARAECEVRGHEWGGWGDCRFAPERPFSIRYCIRCDACETRPLDTTPAS